MREQAALFTQVDPFDLIEATRAQIEDDGAVENGGTFPAQPPVLELVAAHPRASELRQLVVMPGVIFLFWVSTGRAQPSHHGYEIIVTGYTYVQPNPDGFRPQSVFG